MSGMDFFGQQERARRASGRLVVLFALAVIGIIASIWAAAELLLTANDARPGPHWEVLAAVAGVTVAVVGGATAIKTMQLRSGGGKVATMLGGTPVAVDTTEPRERMLRNIVEEIAIASGLPVPEIYVLENETGINAFAAGWGPPDAAVAVTRGCLEQLDRDELQGVIAHEFSHVFHGDMRLNIRLIGVLFGIVCIATIGRVLLRAAPRSSSRDKKGGAAAIALFGLALVVIGWIGVFFARLIQAAVSRQREFLADAAAVQYTRNPRGIGLALAKIGGLTAKLETPHAEEASHLLFADGVGRLLGGALATHPPVEERVERILPGFRRHLANAPSMVAAAVAVAPSPPPAPARAAGAATAGLVAGLAGAAAAPRASGADLVRAVGAPQAANVQTARELLDALPLDLAAATHEPARAHALVCALLLDRDPARREAQLRPLASLPAVVHEIRVAFQAVARLDRALRLPLVELAVPALRALPGDTRTRLRSTMRALADADGEVSPFEWALQRIVERHVRVDGEPPPRPPARPTALLDHRDAVATVLSVLARSGANGDEPRAAAAFARGAAALGVPADLALAPPHRSGTADLAAAVDALARLSPLGKRNLLAGCAETALADGSVDADEADLLRALATLWDCPVPLGRHAAP
jgi:Zn-dependent protease with chaperone function/uncharacterized tellurite resistance protein B-like protein